MFDLLLLGGIVVLIILFSEQKKTVNSLRTRLDDLEAADLAPPENKPEPESQSATPSKEASAKKLDPAVEPVKRAAKTASPPEKIARQLEDPERASPPPTNSDAPKPAPSLSKRFEELIGGKLPIWIGGIALVFAGFFLVRFSIEAGLFGPTARCITAALFGLTMIGLSEFGGKLPKIGHIFSEDKRIGHSLAGAGIAVLYANLYMASELYGLLGLTGALAGVAAVTILAFFLSQKHGPPTAIMGLLGGFAAPYVAGLGPESVAPLLIYLGVFTAGLFGLAIHRGWTWLALLATGGSVIWTTALLLMDVSSDTSFVGAFIVLLAIGGALTLARTRASFGLPRMVVQSIPLVAGLLQLALLAPLVEFSALSWLFFGALALFAIALAWRDEEMTPAAGGSTALIAAMLGYAFSEYGSDQPDLLPAIGFSILFGAAGHAFMNREKSGWMWALIGMAGPGAILLFAAMFAEFGWSDGIWGGVCLVVAISSAGFAWRTGEMSKKAVMPLASAMTAILLACALWLWTPSEFTAIVAVLVAGCLAFWTRFTGNRLIAVETTIAVVITGLLMLIPGGGIVEAMFASLAGETDLFSYLPNPAEMIMKILVPSAAIIGLAAFFKAALGPRLSGVIASIGGISLAAFAYLLYKQPLAIGPMQQFVQYGFAERALLTQLLAVGGWLLLSRPWNERFEKSLKMLGVVLAGLALLRFIYLDLLVFSPTNVKQLVGPAPLANLATLHFAAVAIWLWLFARMDIVGQTSPRFKKPLEIGSLLAAIAAVMITVRQAVHGNDIATPPFTSTETYLYSAGLLLLAIVWLIRGIKSVNALLRIAGLLLLTIITFKVFLIDAAQLDGVLRILSFLGLGIALIGIGWIYGKVMKAGETDEPESES